MARVRRIASLSGMTSVRRMARLRRITILREFLGELGVSAVQSGSEIALDRPIGRL
jgi:hypothetical protein